MDRLRILVVGHSVMHPRQLALWRGLADLGHTVHVFGPSEWADETYFGTTYDAATGGRLMAHPSGGKRASFLRWRPIGVWSQVKVMGRFDVLYVMQEPWCLLARDALGFAARSETPTALFTWENRFDVPGIFGRDYANLELENLQHPQLKLVVAGSRPAAHRIRSLGTHARVEVCPQTGVDTELFQPIPIVSKTTFAIYVGRLAPEKGLRIIEEACHNLNIPLVIKGGRGTFPSMLHHARMEPWTNDWQTLPLAYNSAEVHVSHPYGLGNYQEQFGYAYAEAMACGLVSIATTNGSIPDAFAGSPLIMTREGDIEQLKENLHGLRQSADARRRIGEAGRKWVTENLSLPVMTRHLEGLLKGAAGGSA